MTKRYTANGLLYFLAGIGIGAVVALLFAPQSGEETRQMINDKVEQGKDYISEQRRAIRRTAEDFMTEGRRRVEDVRSKAKDFAERAGLSGIGEH